MAARSKFEDVASGKGVGSPPSKGYGHAGSPDAAVSGDGALARIVAVEERLSGLVSRARTRAEALVAGAKERAARRSSVERERLEAAEAALRAEIAAERERRLAEIRAEAERELARYAEVDADTVEALATWVLDRVVAAEGDGAEGGDP